MFWLLILIHNVPPFSDLFYRRTKDLPPLLATYNRPRPAFVWPCQGRPKGARRAEGPLPGQIRRYNERRAEAVLVSRLFFILFQRKSSFVAPPVLLLIVSITISRINCRRIFDFSLSVISIPGFKKERKSKTPRFGAFLMLTKYISSTSVSEMANFNSCKALHSKTS